jgi:hypothetical protein
MIAFALGQRGPDRCYGDTRCRDAFSLGQPTPGIAIVGLDRGHDRFGSLGARRRR